MRAGYKRPQTHALRAAQKGAPAYLMTNHMKRRKALRKKKNRSAKRPRDPLLALLAVRRKV